MRIAVPRETAPNETRVALVPETVARLVKAGLEVMVEVGAGERACFPDESYRSAGAVISPGPAAAYDGAGMILKVREPGLNDVLHAHEVDLIPAGAVVIGFLGRDRSSALAARLSARHVTAFSMDLVPRISRAQKMDALSSMSTVAGYKAALVAAERLGRFFPLLMTAAGTVPPARVFVLGAGVAGLQAIATARRLGAVVEAFDVRPAVREEVQSLGATFVGQELLDQAAEDAGGYAREASADQQQRQRALIHERLKQADAVISTAMVPGRRAPVLITAAMVHDMRPGSVIVDLAAEMGGNCELTTPGGEVTRDGVRIIGPVNLAATVPVHASQMYSRNISALALHLIKDGKLNLDFEDEITRESCLVRVERGPAAQEPPAHGSPAQGSPVQGPPAPMPAGKSS